MRTRVFWLVISVLALGLVSTSSAAYAGTEVKLSARLSGAQEVPAADPDGRGSADVRIDIAAGQVCFDIKIHDTGAPNRGHIHAGAAGVNGPIVVPFFELRTTPPDALPSDPRSDAIERGRLQDCVSASPTLLADIVANPQNYYVNVHNARFPGGALRCQLER